MRVRETFTFVRDSVTTPPSAAGKTRTERRRRVHSKAVPGRFRRRLHRARVRLKPEALKQIAYAPEY